MSEHSLNFTNISVQKGRDTPKFPTPVLAFDKKSIYVSSNYGLKFKDVSIEKSEHEKLVDRRRREKSVVLTLKTNKLNVVATLSNPNAQDKRRFDDFMENLEYARGRVVGKKGALNSNVKSMGKVSTNLPKKRAALNTITPARGVYMSSPRKSPGRLARSLTPMKRQIGSRRTESSEISQQHHVETKGNVVTAPKERREMKLNPKSPRRATPSRREVEPKMEVKRSVFSQEEYEEQSDEQDLLDDDRMSEDDLLEDSPEVPKRKRLMKLKKSIEDEDSDVEFEEPKAKKKLRLEEEEAPSPEDRDVWMGMNSGIEGKDTDSGTDDNDDKTNNGEEETEEPNNENSNEKEKNAVNPKSTKTIHSFFTAKPSAKPKAKSDTFGSAIMSSPQRSIKASTSTPPPSVPERAPALKQLQRTGIKSSRYFQSVEKKENNDDLNDERYQDDGEYYEGNVSEKEKDEPQKRQFVKSYGTKQPRNPYSNYNSFKLGRSRLATPGRTESGRKFPPSLPRDSSLPRNGNGEISPAKRLQFGLSSTADRALGSGRKLSPPRPLEPIPPSKPSIAGIQNLGNTCYLSASLQNLFSIPNFLRDLYKVYELEGTKKDMPLTKALLEIAVVIEAIPADQMPEIDGNVAASKLSTNKAANPSALKKQMDLLTDKFVGYEQRDAHEFLSDLVDYLHEELVAKEKKDGAEGKDISDKDKSAADEDASSSDKENDDSVSAEVNSTPEKKNDVGDAVDAKKDMSPASAVPPTDDYFHLKVRVCLECDSCKYSRSKEEMYRHLSLDVGEDLENDPWTVKRGLDQFFQPEKRELKCEKCSDGTHATQTIEIISCPKALLLHFKRFIVTQEVRAPANTSDDKEDAPPVMEMVLKKNKARINLENTFSVPIFATEAKYNLRGVVHHVGNTAFSGHYTSCGLRANTTDVKDHEEQWVYFDDRVGVKKEFDYVASNEKNQRNCYMALYELC